MFKRLFRKFKSLFRKPKLHKRPIVRKDLPKLFYPLATFLPDEPYLKTRYKRSPLSKDYILTIHTTAGWQKQSGQSFIKSFLKNGYCTDFLDMHGTIFQQSHGDRSGYHAGKSSWHGKTSISKYGRGLEIACGGKLKEKDNKYYTWFGKEVTYPRYVQDSPSLKIHGGWYERLTQKQEDSLAKYLIWWCNQGVNPDNIVSHDWIAYDRKTDVGGALSVPLKRFIDEQVKPYIKERA